MPGDNLGNLIDRARRLEADAWDQLYRRAFPQVYRYVSARIESAAEAEDVAEEVFVGALQTIASLRARDESGLLAWLFQIARHKIADYRRRQYRRPTEPLDPAAEVDDPAPSPEELALRADEVRALRAALDALSPEQREVIILKFALGYDNARAAAVLGKSPGAINQLQHRGLRTLGRLLGPVKASEDRCS